MGHQSWRPPWRRSSWVGFESPVGIFCSTVSAYSDHLLLNFKVTKIYRFSNVLRAHN